MHPKAVLYALRGYSPAGFHGTAFPRDRRLLPPQGVEPSHILAWDLYGRRGCWDVIYTHDFGGYEHLGWEDMPDVALDALPDDPDVLINNRWL